MTDRTQILSRVLNLRAKAEDTTSEAEALSAMRIAEKMMRSYHIEEAELALAEGLGEIKVEVETVLRWDVGIKNGRVRHPVQGCIWMLGRYCDVEVILKSNYYHGSSSGLEVTGDKPDLELFWYLLDVIRTAMDRSYASWKRTQRGVGRGAKTTFMSAMARRLNDRLLEMKEAQKQERADAERDAAKLLNVDAEDIRTAVSAGDMSMLASNMSLVVASVAEQKERAVKTAFASRYAGVRLGTARGMSSGTGSTTAFQAGTKAGNNVSLARGVGRSSPALLS